MLNARLAAAATAAALLGACASQPPSALTGARVPSERYSATFQAAREVVRAHRFTTDRVDAQQGVITTIGRPGGGVLRPWDAQSGAAAAWDDSLNYQLRAVQVVFLTADAPSRADSGRIIPPAHPDRDLAAAPEETTLLVRVTVDRVERDSRQISADSVRVERQAVNPELAAQGNWPRYLVQQPDDTVLAAELLRLIVARAEVIATTPPPARPPSAGAPAVDAAATAPPAEPSPVAEPQR